MQSPCDIPWCLIQESFMESFRGRYTVPPSFLPLFVARFSSPVKQLQCSTLFQVFLKKLGRKKGLGHLVQQSGKQHPSRRSWQGSLLENQRAVPHWLHKQFTQKKKKGFLFKIRLTFLFITRDNLVVN